MSKQKRIKLRRGTAAQWAAANPVLSVGEPGVATDTTVLKIGDGSTAWNDLASVVDLAGGIIDHSNTTVDVHGIADTGDLLTVDDIGVTVQPRSDVLDATTASYTVEDKGKIDALGTAATFDASAFDPAGAAAAAQDAAIAASQPLAAVLTNTTASFTTADESKLDGIEAGATADQTANEILTAIKTVDGDLSGLDADLLDGLHGADYVRYTESSTAFMSFVVDEDDFGEADGSDTKVPTQQSVKAYVDFKSGKTLEAAQGAIQDAIDALLGGAPGALDTLNELAAAINDDEAFAATVTTALANKQPLDSDLTEIAALTTTAFGRSLLTLASASAGRSTLGLVIGTNVQAYSSVLQNTTASFTLADETKLDGIEAGAQANTVASVNSATGAVVLDADDIDDTSTTNKFATSAQLAKVDAISTFGASLIDDVDAAAALATLGIGSLGVHTTSDTAPVSPSINDTWTDSTRGTMLYWTGFEWAEIATGTLSAMTLSGPLDAAGNVVTNVGAVEQLVNTVASSGASTALNVSSYGVHDVTMTENCDITFSGFGPAGKAYSWTLILRGGFTPTFPVSVLWDAGAEPVYQSASIYTFVSVDAGTTVFGFKNGGAFA